MTHWPISLLLLTLSAEPQVPEPEFVPPGDREPVLQLEAGGPTAFVTSLAFSPDGTTLYAGGYDKVVRAWQLRDDKFELDPRRTFRVPIGPGSDGVVNALAVSPDGRWLALAGKGTLRHAAGFREPGFVVPSDGRLTDAMRLDQGTIYIYDARTAGFARALRGHRGVILSMVFAPARTNKPPLLLSAAREWRKGETIGCVRLWNAETGEEVAATFDLPDPGDRRPGLAAWHAGAANNALRVGLAWRDRKFRAWEVARNQVREVGTDGATNDTIVHLPGKGGGRLTTGSLRDGGASLQTWTIASGRVTRAAERPVLVKGTSYPRALAAAKGKLAVVTNTTSDPDNPAGDVYRLALVSAAEGKEFGKVVARTELWRGGERAQPAVALSPDGLRIAIAGNQHHEILVFDAGKELKLRQTLRSAGTTFRSLAFVTREQQLGLRLTGMAGDAALFVDFQGRRLVDDPAGWVVDAPDRTGWQARFENAEGERPAAFVVTRGEAVMGRVAMTAGQRPTAASLLPRRPRLAESVALGVAGARALPPQPLLAVAYDELGVTYLGLFDVASGLKIREFTGHVNAIQALAFSRDGTLLASTALDQSICLWSLVDLTETLGKAGGLRGLAVGRQPDALRVARIDPAAMTAANLRALRAAGVQADDVIEGAVEGERLRPFDSAQSFYRLLWQQPPGGRVTLRVRGRGDVNFVLDPAIDERKPLFTLFITTDDAPTGRQWIGWSPHGPYDTSDPVRTEGYIGWHRNTGNAAAPTSFSFAREYRREYFHPGLLPYLLGRGDFARGLRDWKDAPAASTGMTLQVDSFDLGEQPQRDARGNLIIRRVPTRVLAAVQGLPPVKVASVGWRLDGGPLQRFTQTTDAGVAAQTFEGEVVNRNWARGVHRLELVVTPHEANARERVEALSLLYLPPAPRVETPMGWGRRVIAAQARHDLRAVIVPGEGMPADSVRVLVRHNGQAVPLAARDLTVQDGRIHLDRALELTDGLNEIEIVAENVGRLDDSAAFESARSGVQEIVLEKPELPPQIGLREVAVAGREPMRVDKEPLTVVAPAVRIRGRITAQEPLTAVLLNGKPLESFAKALDRRDFAIDEPLTLKPGEPQRFTFDAQTAKAKAAPRSITLVYHSEPPGFTFLEPNEGRRAPSDPMEILLLGRLSETSSDVEFQAAVRLNGEPVAGVQVDRTSWMLSAPLRLRPGANRIEVRTSNAWSQGLTQERTVYCPRLPRIAALRAMVAEEQPRATLVAEIESPRDLPLIGLRLEGSQRATPELQAEEYRITPPREGMVAWTVTIPDVPLAEGQNLLALVARSIDGSSREPGRVAVPFARPLPSPPTISLLEPRERPPQDTPAFRFRFAVRSAAPLESVSLRRADQDIPIQANIQLVERTADGSAIYEANLQLAKEANLLTVVARNAGGTARSPEVTVSFLPRTKTIHLDRLVPAAAPRTVLPVSSEGAQLSFAEAPTGAVVLHGHVAWPDAADPTLKQDLRLRVWVNDFEQFDARLDEADGLRRYFRAELRLNKANNHVAVALPGANLEAATRTEFTVACAKPDQDQRMHLLIVSPGRRDREALRQDVLEAFHVSDDSLSGNRFKAPAFQTGWVYGPLEADTDPEAVYGTVLRIKATLRRTAGPLNDVVLVYFQGEEAPKEEDLLLVTEKYRRSGYRSETAISCARLRNILADVRGAKLLLMNVRRPSETVRQSIHLPTVAAAPDRVAILRYAWLHGDQVPPEARLLTFLRQALARSGPLRDVSKQIDDLLRPLEGKYAGQWSKIYNDVLASLQLGTQFE